MFTKLWTDIKQWFNYSWSIFIARMEIIAGILTGALAGLDWTALMNLKWGDAVSSKTNLAIAALVVLKGIFSELGRRTGTVVAANSQLVPENVAAKAKIKIAE